MAIYDVQTEVAVVTATIPAATSAALTGLFRYVSVSPVVLAPNTGYIIAASCAPTADPFVWSPAISTPRAIIRDLSIDPAITLGITSTGLPASARSLEFTDVGAKGDGADYGGQTDRRSQSKVVKVGWRIPPSVGDVET